MVIAATTFAQAAFCLGDDPRLIRRSPRAAAAILVQVLTPGPAATWPCFSAEFCENQELRRSLEKDF
jgi:hypothetical protein